MRSNRGGEDSVYIDKIMPFLKDSDFVKIDYEMVPVSEIYCPLLEEGVNNGEMVESGESSEKAINLFYVLPCKKYVVNDRDSLSIDIKRGRFGSVIQASVTTLDYGHLAKRIEVQDGKAMIKMNGAFIVSDDVVTDLFVNTAANGTEVPEELITSISIPYESKGSFRNWLSTQKINEAGLGMAAMIALQKKNGNTVEFKDDNDFVYKWLDSYFSLPEGEWMKDNEGREMVPLLIGPTGVFKSATIKELCKKYNYRMVDFRISFVSRLDFTGMYQMGKIPGDSKDYSYSCPMEEIVTCSDGFREFCKRAKEAIEKMLSDGTVDSNKSSDGNSVVVDKKTLSEDNVKQLKDLVDKYDNYLRTPVLFFDEITRTKDDGVNGVLTSLLNQKTLNNMTLHQCKFVAATNLNLKNQNARHDRNMAALDSLYDVNDDLDIAYKARFQPLNVLPNDVKDRWLSWAAGEKEIKGEMGTNIHPLIREFLSKNPKLIYDESPILDAIESGKSDQEKKAQTFPNYRTWEMVSDYVYSVDSDSKVTHKHVEGKKDIPDGTKMYRDTIINGLISAQTGDKFAVFLRTKGYKLYTDVLGNVNDDVGDFLDSTLSAGVPALLIGPSSLGKTSRVKAYMRKVEKSTGIKPLLMNINLASMDTVDLMGMPTKKTIYSYVAGNTEKSPVGDAVNSTLAKIMGEVRKEKKEMGMVDTLTVRAPDKGMGEQFKEALANGREVILFFDECNRVKNPTIMSAMFECISDYRIFGISFKENKDRVKIVAACNMSHSELGANINGADADKVGDYGAAGDIDPALAARFSVFWKKNFDEKDVNSFIDFMSEGQKDGSVDGILLDFFKSLPMSGALRAMASVEKRVLEYAEPSTRAINQLSKDIMSMRGKKGTTNYQASLYKGRVIFNELFRNKFSSLNASYGNPRMSDTDLGNETLDTLKMFFSKCDDWEPVLDNKTATVCGTVVTAGGIIDDLRDGSQMIKDILARPITVSDSKNLKELVNQILIELEAANRMDTSVVETRKKSFESYLGEEFTRDFLPYFNEVFGSQEDVEITIPMLVDEEKIEPFMNRFFTKMSSDTTDMMVDKMLNLMKDFWKEFPGTIPYKNYATLIRCVKSVLPSADSMAELLHKSNKDVDGIFTMAEGDSDSFVREVLKAYPGSHFGPQEIEDMRKAMIKSSPKVKARRGMLL